MTNQSKLIAIYPGSFDPLTYGHLDIIKRSIKIVNTLIIGIGVNPEKQHKSFFSSSENKSVILNCVKEELTTEEFSKIKVKSFEGLLVNFALKNNAKVIIRGLRALSDFNFEFNLASGNQVLNSDIESVFFITSVNKQFISSKLVKEIFLLNGDISKFVPPHIEKKMKLKQASLSNSN